MKLSLKKNEIATIQSASFEAEYRRILMAMANEHARYVKANILPVYAREKRIADAAGDETASAFERFKKFMEETAQFIATGLMKRLFEVEKARGDENFSKLAQSKLGIDLRSTLSRDKKLEAAFALRTAENVRLIKSMSGDQISRIEGIMYRGVLAGEGNKIIAQNLAQELQISKKRAILIARDQSSKFNADLNKVRQEAAGISKYRWLTAGDERVRATHRANDGKIFAWSTPPSETGHPSHDVNCRCVAIGIFE